MVRQGRLGWFALLLAASPLGAQPPVLPPEALEDARLADACFVDPDRGWAVGDRGVIWHTRDGGRQWTRQFTPTSSRLNSVCFLDDQNGWAVGGWTHPFSHFTSGEVLRTTDGGRRWERTASQTLPALRKTRFLNPKQGWAIGAASAMYPSGAFRTEDGGRSWSPLPGGDGRSWLAGELRDLRSGIVVGGDGVSLIFPQNWRTPKLPDVGLRGLRDVRLTAGNAGWIVGDGGLVLRTSDSGQSWLPTALPEAAPFDFHTLATLGNHVWLAGSPGTTVFHSADGGRTWDTYRTGQSLPLHGLTFLDASRGWAVGELGTILATRDGGRSWRKQRGPATRLALLGVCGDPGRIPLELLALSSGTEGHLSAVEILHKPAETTESAVHESVLAAGGSAGATAWAFPVADAESRLPLATIVRGWEPANATVEALELHLVKRIRQWRPDVIVTESAAPKGDRPLEQLTHQLVHTAVQRAADPQAFAETMRALGLEPWRVKKVCARATSGEYSSVTLTPVQLSPQLGGTLADQAARARSLIEDRFRLESQPQSFRVTVSQTTGESAGRQGLFAGLSLLPGGEARRATSMSAAGNLETVSRLAQKTRTIQQLLVRNAESRGGVLLGQVENLVRGLEPATAAEILFQLAQKLEDTGQFEFAADVHSHLLERFPQQDLAESSALRLIRFYTSGEMAVRLRRRNADAAPDRATPASVQAQVAGLQPNFAVEATVTESDPSDPSEQRLRRAVTIAQKIAATRPGVFAEPALRFPLAAAQRQLGSAPEAESFYQTLAGASLRNPWRPNAVGELWLIHRKGRPAKSICRIKPTSTKPRLDGRLDDVTWRDVPPQELVAGTAEPPATQALFACDDEFLFVAFRCPRAAGTEPVSAGSRQRDPDFRDRDRIELSLDLDRDYVTTWKFTVDSRGHAGESCVGDASWNPSWFVAVSTEPDAWTAEIAIPFREIALQPPRARDVWALGLRRVVPGHGVQTWTQPVASTSSGCDLGWLLFE